MIINPNNTEHTISFVPRYYPSGTIYFKLVDSASDYVLDDTESVYSISTDGKIEFTIYADVISETRYQLTIEEEASSEVLYRGIVIATSQDTQEYQLTNDKYYF